MLGYALLILLAVAAWIVILTWLAGAAMRFLRRRTGWGAMDWRVLGLSFAGLVAAIHFGNAAIDALSPDAPGLEPSFPGAFLIGSVAIGVGIAAVRARGR